jgi:CheY-like chemotaxis protein
MTANAAPGNAPNDDGTRNVVIKDRRRRNLLKPGSLHNAILNSTAFSSIATDDKGVIQIFNAGAKRMLGYTGAELVNKLTPAAFSDPAELIERASALSLEFGIAIAPGFEALVFKASRGIEDNYGLTYVRKDGSRLAAIVSVTALHDPRGAIVGYLLIATDVAAPLPSAAAAPRPAADKPEPVARAQSQPHRKLLYVEDHPASVGLVEQLVARRPDVLLLRAADMHIGIELARAARPEVILLNIDLPGLSAGVGALEFMKLLRADANTKSTPILALGANAAPVAIARALEAGFFHYLTKPMKAETFMEALGDALEFAARERAEENDMPSRAAHSH